MNIAFVGCGFVFDIYMRTREAHSEISILGVFDIDAERARQVGEFYGLHVYNSLEELLSHDAVEIVVNLTNISAHFEVSKRILEARKHVYSEKPLAINVEDCQELFDCAERYGVCFQGAPCNVYSDSVRTMIDVIEQGAIGKPLLVYAELDDNPIHLMDFQDVRSPSGAPWPLEEEIREGCTYEHVGYHLIWICALLGPAIGVTAHSAELIGGKLPGSDVNAMSGTPDYSVACLQFASGAAARVTCSVVAPRDHRMRVIGRDGEVSTDGYRHYQSPVYLERFSKRSLSARKFRTLREQSWLGRMFGMGGRKQKLLSHWKSDATKRNHQGRLSLKAKLVEWLRRREVYAQDKFIGIAELARSIENGTEPYLTPNFLMHINELTLLIQNAGPFGKTVKPKTQFEPLGKIPGTIETP